jgi:hypothetical protein
MKTYHLFPFFLLIFSHIANAALPPTAEIMRRIKTIMDSKEVYDTLGSANWIHAISEENGVYSIRTEKCTLKVTLDSSPLSTEKPQMVGPSKLTVKIGTLACKDKS